MYSRLSDFSSLIDTFFVGVFERSHGTFGEQINSKSFKKFRILVPFKKELKPQKEK